uniref:Protein kinase domain-containing protein n=1 Tax=Dunaliella tertiolecta TaxID=3047 RepID=A0A7S3VP34_DUNTE|mmetsp:Transcript_28301/g.76439  ORF Transcript_28301/g.76439 Transcript_28301/m.76439 type:complete len:849 (+) Transcript_28301:132-2678(+)
MTVSSGFSCVGGAVRDSAGEYSQQDNMLRQRLQRASTAEGETQESSIGMQVSLPPHHHQQQQAKAAERLSAEELTTVLRGLPADCPDQSCYSLPNLSSPPNSSNSCQAQPISFSKASCPPPGGSSPIGGSPSEAPFLLACKSTQLKLAPHHSSLSASCPHSSVLAPGSFKEEQGSRERKASMGRSISAIFKGAFKSSLFSPSSNSISLNHISGPAAVPSPPSITSAGSLSQKRKSLSVDTQPMQPCSPTKGTSPIQKGLPKNGSFSFKAMLNSLQSPGSSQPPSPAAPAPPTTQALSPPPPAQPLGLNTPPKEVAPISNAGPERAQGASSKSLDVTVAREAEAKAAAFRRAISVSGRVGAPSMLLVVTKDLPPRMSRPCWCLKDYVVLEKMYTGYASNVFKARCKHSGVLVCLKSYNLGNLCELNRFQIFREVKLHSSLSHEHVIKLYGAFQQADQVVLVQEFANMGDLFTLLHRYGGRLPERTAVELVLQPFLSVLNYLHANGIAHRDIKPENILYTSDMRLKLADFGLAINMREERAVTRAGTLEYMAPEVLDCPFKNKPEENKGNRMLHYSYHVDTWAVGVLAYELLVGLPPFNDKQRNAVEDKIRLAPPRFPSKMSEECRGFITMALEKNPLERPTVMELLTHPWMKMHKRSSSIQHLSSMEKQGTHGMNHSASQVLNLPTMEGPEYSECGAQQAPPQQPIPQPPRQGAAAASLGNVKAPAGNRGTPNVLSSSLTAGALPPAASPKAGAVEVDVRASQVAKATASAVLDSHTGQQQQQQQHWHGSTDNSPSKPHTSAIAPVADTLSPLPRPPTCFLSFSNPNGPPNISKASPPLNASSQPLPCL